MIVGRRVEDFLSEVLVFEPRYLDSAHEKFVMLTMMIGEIMKKVRAFSRAYCCIEYNRISVSIQRR